MFITAICDDDAEYRNLLEKKIQEYSCGNMEIYHFSSGEELLASPLISHITLFFIDMVLPEMDGTGVARMVRKFNHDGVIVLCSGIRQPQVNCFGMDVFRYILKYEVKHTDQSIVDAINRVYEFFGQAAFVYTAKESSVCVSTGNIVYVERSLRGCVFHMRGDDSLKSEEAICKDKLEEVYKRLRSVPDVHFGFPHTSYVVNLRYVKKILRYYLVLDSGEELNISKTRFQEFNSDFMNMLGKKYPGKW